MRNLFSLHGLGSLGGRYFCMKHFARSRRMKWAGNVARMGELRNAYEMLIGKPEGKRSLRRPRHRTNYFHAAAFIEKLVVAQIVKKLLTYSDPNVHYRDHKSPSLALRSILSQMNPVLTLPSFFFKTHFNGLLASRLRLDLADGLFPQLLTAQ